MRDELIKLAIAEVPDLIQALKAAFKKDNPTTPPPTDAEVIAAFNSAFISSLAKDAAWLAQHPS